MQATRAIEALQRNSPGDGLFPGYIALGGSPVWGSPVTMGAFCDSFYEYLIKVRPCGQHHLCTTCVRGCVSCVDC